MSGHTDAPVRCRGCGTIVPAYITGMAAMSRERPYSLSDEFHRYTMESDGLWRCGACQTSDELRKAWALIESLQADREKNRAELAALRERVAKLEAALVKAEDVTKKIVGSPPLAGWLPDTSEARASLQALREALITAREATK